MRSFINALKRGVFPHEMSFFLELRWRNIVLSPRKLAARLSLSATSCVLEVGAGSGFYSVEIAERVSEGQVELLDLQIEMLRKTRHKIESIGLSSNIGYAVADAGKLPFKENVFDVIFLVTVLGEIVDQKAFLREARRILKPQGILSISEHLPDPDFSALGKVKSLVEKEGFEFFERYGTNWNYTANFRRSEAKHVLS